MAEQPAEPLDELPEPWVPQPPTDRTFSGRLRLIRLHLDITQTEAASRCGIKRVTWSAWETNPERSPRNVNDIAQRVHDGLGVDLHWLAFGPQSHNVHGPDTQLEMFFANGQPTADYTRSPAGFALVS